MDNIKLVTILSDYGIFCLERQKSVLAAYRKIRRERWNFVGIILATLVSIVVIALSIWGAVLEYIDSWVPAVLLGPAGALVGLLIITAKTPLDNIREVKAFIAEANSIPNTLEDIVYIVNSLNDDDTEEDEQ